MEEKCAELYGETKIRGFLHLYVGEEAVAAGSLRALTADDAVVATYREHAHALLRGMPMTSIMAEMFGKQEGCSRGRGGSMHLFDAAIRFYGGNAIVAGGLPLAVGLGLADAMQHRNRVTACHFGDSAVAEGAFHESLNMAALWQLPVLFCCENNLYAMGTALERAQSQTDLTAKAAAYKVPIVAVDGMDVIACHDAAQQGADHIRSAGGPFFIEFRTYRFRAHSMFDPNCTARRPRSKSGASATRSAPSASNACGTAPSPRAISPRSNRRPTRNSVMRSPSPKPEHGKTLTISNVMCSLQYQWVPNEDDIPHCNSRRHAGRAARRPPSGVDGRGRRQVRRYVCGFRTIPPTKQVAKLAAGIHARGHITFGGCQGLHRSKDGQNRTSDWRDEADVKRWVESVMAELVAPGPAQQRRRQSNR